MNKKVFYPKLFSLLKDGITSKQVMADSLSGLVVGVLALPLAIAFAVASGVSPEKGLITAVIAGFLISFFGGSRVQIGGPTGAFIVIVYSIIEQYGFNGLLISTILAGLILIAFGLMRLGTLLKYFPYPLIVGFTSGIALIIFSTQIKDALGLEIAKVPSAFVDKCLAYADNITSLNYTALLITLFCILTTVYFRKVTTKVPGAFVAIILASVGVQVLHLDVATIETFFGDIPNKIEFSLPQWQWAELHQYFLPALTIALLGAIESLLSAVVSDGMIGGKHRSNTELIAQGIANIVTPFFGGIPATGAIARTATNVKNGGRTPIAGIVHALALLLIMLFLGKWAKLIPMSALAGVLIVVAYNMSEWRAFIAVLKGSNFDRIILLTTFTLTVLVDLTVAIQVGVVLSALLFMKRMADLSEKKIEKTLDSDVLEDYSKVNKGVAIYEISGPLFFASARRYSEVIELLGLESKVLILRMRHVPFIDLTGVKNLKEAILALKEKGIVVLLSGVQDNVLKELDKYDVASLVSEEHIYSHFDKALEEANKLAE